MSELANKSTTADCVARLCSLGFRVSDKASSEGMFSRAQYIAWNRGLNLFVGPSYAVVTWIEGYDYPPPTSSGAKFVHASTTEATR